MLAGILVAAARPRRRCAGSPTPGPRFHRGCARFLLGIRTRVEGEVPRGPALVAAKHQSMFETTEIWSLILDTPATVMKSELRPTSRSGAG